MTLQFSLIEYATPEYDQALCLRYKVLRRPLNLEYTEEQIQSEWNSIHIGGFDAQQNLIAYLMFTPEANKLQMRQVVVEESWQNKGIGKELVKAAEIWAIENNYKQIFLHARDTAIPFYLSLNYQLEGEEFYEVGILHRNMIKEI